MRRVPNLLLLLLLAVPVFSQNSSQNNNDAQNSSQLSQEIVREIRALRADLATSSSTAQRIQIALYRLYQQEKATERAKGNADSCRASLNQLELRRKYASDQAKQMEKQLKEISDSEERKETAEALDGTKARIVELDQEILNAQGALAAAEQELKSEQMKLEAAEELLAQLDAALAAISRKTTGSLQAAMETAPR